MRVVDGRSAAELRSLARAESDPRMVVRLQAVALARAGATAPAGAPAVGYSRRAVQLWVRWYNRGGVDLLRDEGGRGRKPPLTAGEAERLRARLAAGPLPGDGVCALRGADVRGILEREFGKVRCLSAVYGLLHRLGYNDLVPRPRHPAADPAAQAAFKKTRRGWSRRSGRGTPASGCRPGSRTSAASASRAR